MRAQISLLQQVCLTVTDSAAAATQGEKSMSVAGWKVRSLHLEPLFSMGWTWFVFHMLNWVFQCLPFIGTVTFHRCVSTPTQDNRGCTTARAFWYHHCTHSVLNAHYVFVWFLTCLLLQHTNTSRKLVEHYTVAWNHISGLKLHQTRGGCFDNALVASGAVQSS